MIGENGNNRLERMGKIGENGKCGRNMKGWRDCGGVERMRKKLGE